MRGFDDKALILFPNADVYAEGSLRYRYQLQLATKNLVEYLRSIGMEPRAFVTDDLARTLPELNLRFINTLTKGDLFFVANNCDIGKSVMRMDMIEYPEIAAEIAEKDKMESDISLEERFNHILTRDKKAITSIIPMYKVVVNFTYKGRSRYRVVVKPNGGKIRMLIDASTFKIKTYINNIEEDPIDLLGVGYGNKSLISWEV